MVVVILEDKIITAEEVTMVVETIPVEVVTGTAITEVHQVRLTTSIMEDFKIQVEKGDGM